MTTTVTPIRPVGDEYLDVGALDTDTIALITLAVHHPEHLNPYRDSVIELAVGDDAPAIYCLLAEYAARQIREHRYPECLGALWAADDDFECWAERYLEHGVIEPGDAPALSAVQGLVARYCTGFRRTGYTRDELALINWNRVGLIRAALATARDFTHMIGSPTD